MCLFSQHIRASIKNPPQRYYFFLIYARKKRIISNFCAFSLQNIAVFYFQSLCNSISKLCSIPKIKAILFRKLWKSIECFCDVLLR